MREMNTERRFLRGPILPRVGPSMESLPPPGIPPPYQKRCEIGQSVVVIPLVGFLQGLTTVASLVYDICLSALVANPRFSLGSNRQCNNEFISLLNEIHHYWQILPPYGFIHGIYLTKFKEIYGEWQNRYKGLTQELYMHRTQPLHNQMKPLIINISRKLDNQQSWIHLIGSNRQCTELLQKISILPPCLLLHPEDIIYTYYNVALWFLSEDCFGKSTV